MIKKNQARLIGLLLGLSSGAAFATLTCNKCPPLDEVHCATSWTGPLAHFWDWGAGNLGSYYGAWATPDNFPSRNWTCNGSDAPIDFHVPILFQDDTFAFEILYDVRCVKIVSA